MTKSLIDQDMETMAQRLQIALDARKKKAPWLIDTMKVSKGTIYNILNDVTKPIKVRASTVTAICNLLKIREEWLLTGELPMDLPVNRVITTASGALPRHAENNIVAVATNEILNGYLRIPQMDLPAGSDPESEVSKEPTVVRWIDVAVRWAEVHFGQRIPNIRAFTVRSNSMAGAGIHKDDLLFVDISIRHYQDDGYYIIQFLNDWQVKRLRADVVSQQVEIVTVTVNGEEVRVVPSERLHELRLGGRVSAWWTLRKS